MISAWRGPAIESLGEAQGDSGLATLYDEDYQTKRAYNAFRADLAFAGPPLVQWRLPQRPHW